MRELPRGQLTMAVIVGVVVVMLGHAAIVGRTFGQENTDFQINGGNPLGGPLITLEDIKPGEYKKGSIKLCNNGPNPAECWLCIDNIVTTGGNHPESEWNADSDDEINNIDDFLIIGAKINDNAIIDENTFSEIAHENVYLGVLEPRVEYTLALIFHLRPEITNWAQGDNCTFTAKFLLKQLYVLPPSYPLVELGVGILSIGMAGYIIYWYRGRVKWARIRAKQLKRLKWLKRKLEREK